MRARSAAVLAWVTATFGRDEIGVLVALALIAGGLWQTWRPGALLVPGIVLLWIVLPARHGFIVRSVASDKPARRSTH